MKAIQVHQFGGPENMQLDTVSDRQAGSGEVLLNVKAVGVNPVDTYIRSGVYAMLPPLPYIPGADAAGVVETVGEGVDQFKPGDRVYTAGAAGGMMTGCYAEYVVCQPSQLYLLPENVTFAQGAAVGVPYATAYRGLFHKAQALPGESVLVHGASGAVGIASVELAVSHGMTVIGTAGTERGRALVKEHGAHHVLDHTSSDYLQTLIDLTGGQGPDVILEMLANVNLAKDLEVIARFGRVIIIGNRGEIQINPRMTMGKDSSIIGLALWNASAEEMDSIHCALVAGLANGTLKPVVGREFPLAEAAQAHIAVLEPGAYGKIVLTP